MIDSVHLRDILASKFRSHGAETANTRLFENLPEDVRSRMLQAISLERDELPIVGSVVSSDRWLLLTTKRIVDVEKDHVQVINTDDVKKVTMEPFWKIAALDPSERTKPDVMAQMKMEATMIKLATASGTEHFVRVEPGKPYIGVVNALLHLQHRNRAQQY